MAEQHPGTVPDSLSTVCPGLLSPALRRDLTDLNNQYLELGVAEDRSDDLRFGWSETVQRRLVGLDGLIRRRMAAAPFALFQLLVPPVARDCASAVADIAWGMPAAGWNGRCASFAHQAAFFARRLCDTAPLAANVVLDLAPEAQSVLAKMLPSELAELAAHPGFVRPRWSRHRRFWRMLEAAANAESVVAMQWAHCVGVCLLGVEDEGASAADLSPARHKPRR